MTSLVEFENKIQVRFDLSYHKRNSPASGRPSGRSDLWFLGNALNLALAPVGSNLDVASLNITLELIETRLDLACPPGRNTAVKYGVHLLKGLTLGLGRCQEHVDKSQAIESAENLDMMSGSRAFKEFRMKPYHVHLPVNAPEQGRNGKSKDTVPSPVCSL